jgi:hypothetical protein
LPIEERGYLEVFPFQSLDLERIDPVKARRRQQELRMIPSRRKPHSPDAAAPPA